MSVKNPVEFNELYHHGVQGMKWGKRNGPPYPLNAQGKAKLAKQKKAGRASGGSSNTEGTAAMLVGLGFMTVTTISPYLIAAGAAKIHELKINGKLNKTLKQVEKNKTGEIDELTGFHKKTREMSEEEDVKAVNPGHNTEIKKTDYNCVNCSMTYEMRRRGYDVTAQLSDVGKNGKKYTCEAFKGAKPVPIDVYGVYKKPPYNKEYTPQFKKDEACDKKMAQLNAMASRGVNYDHAQATIDYLSKQKDTRGSIMVQWPAGYGGHAMSYSVDKKGEVHIIDSQVSKIYSGKEVETILARTRTADIIRLDNIKNIDPDKMKEVMH